MSKVSKILIVTLLGLLGLTACGQTGSLYLPPAEKPATSQ
jgi:predicted small lipoprotein YifL